MEDGKHQKLICVCELGRLGDIVASEPIFRYLKRQYPDRKLRWYTRESYAELLKYSPDVDGIVCVKTEDEYLQLKSGFPEGTLSYELNFQHNASLSNLQIPDVAHTSLLARFAGVAGLPPLDESPVFHFRDEIELPPLPARFVLVHCTPGGKARQWTVGKWRKLVQFILDSGVPVVEIGEIPVIQSHHPEFHDLTGRLDLQVAAKIMQAASLFVGVESGFGHIANAVGTLSIILSGKWHGYNDYNLYSGRFGREEGMVFARLDNVEPAQLPYDVVRAIVQRSLEGNPMSSAECRRYCHERQLKDYPQDVLYHVREFFAFPLRKLNLAIEYHRLHHQPRK